MQNSFGYLTSGTGYNGQIFPLAFGETGSFYTSVGPSSSSRFSAHEPDETDIYGKVS